MAVRLLIITIIFLFCAIELVECAEILVFCLMGSLSHHLVIHPLAVGLADKGHRISYLTLADLPDKDPRIDYVFSTQLLAYGAEFRRTLGDPKKRGTNAPNVFTPTYLNASRICEVFYSDPETNAWIGKSRFDLIIVDATYSECAFGLVYKHQSPFILFNTMSFLPWHTDLFGLQPESSWLPDLRLNITHPMSFMERLLNTVSTIKLYLYDVSFNYLPSLSDVIRKGLRDSNFPDVSDMYRNVSLIFVNSYFASEYARSLPPFVIPIGGIHCSGPQINLTGEIARFIDTRAKDGFVFISFGTAFKPTQESLHQMLEATKQFNEIGFIFRWHGAFPVEQAKNVLFTSWAPQQTLLAHPKIRAFVSQCGMLSTQEAIHYGVPVLAIPGFADQDFNAECLVRLGVAHRLEFTTLDKTNFEESLREVLTNPTYKERIRMLQTLYLDRPEQPLDTAIWWTEFVLRHTKLGSDLSLMKPLGINQSWWIVRLLDVYGFIFLIISLILGVLLKILMILLKKSTISKTTSINSEKKTN